MHPKLTVNRGGNLKVQEYSSLLHSRLLGWITMFSFHSSVLKLFLLSRLLPPPIIWKDSEGTVLGGLGFQWLPGSRVFVIL